MKTTQIFDPHRLAQYISPRLLIALSVGVLPIMLGACASLDESGGEPRNEPRNEPRSEQATYRGPVTTGEVKDALARGVLQAEILDQIRRRGARPPNSVEIDQLRLAGADHNVIDSLLKANHATQYIWVNPPRFSFYWGRGSWYWVNDYGWPVYPQPWGWVPDSPRFYGPPPGYPFPIKPSPRPKATPQVGASENGKSGQGKDKDRAETAAAQASVPTAAATNAATTVAPNTSPAAVPSTIQNGRPAYIPKIEK